MVGAVELGGDLRRPRFVVGQHQLDAGVGPVEATGGVDPRPEPEGEVALVEALGRDAAGGHQRPQAGPARAPRLGEPAADQGAVLTPQRDEVGDRCQRDEVELGGATASAPRSGDRELVGDPGRAELAERIAGDDGVQDRAVGKVARRAGGGR